MSLSLTLPKRLILFYYGLSGVFRSVFSTKSWLYSSMEFVEMALLFKALKLIFKISQSYLHLGKALNRSLSRPLALYLPKINFIINSEFPRKSSQKIIELHLVN
jgi:hypothetical protein